MAWRRLASCLGDAAIHVHLVLVAWNSIMTNVSVRISLNGLALIVGRLAGFEVAEFIVLGHMFP